jgi:transcriptional regulator with XRE-family HTH domain
VERVPVLHRAARRRIMAADESQRNQALRKSTSGDDPPSFGRGTGVPDPVDVHVGSRVRTRRLLLGVNQERLARELGLTFQQVQKYESGANRVSASRLWEIAQILGVPISYFFSDVPSLQDEQATGGEDARERMRRPETLELIRLYYAIADQQLRQGFLDMVKAAAGAAQRQD